MALAETVGRVRAGWWQGLLARLANRLKRGPQAVREVDLSPWLRRDIGID